MPAAPITRRLFLGTAAAGCAGAAYALAAGGARVDRSGFPVSKSEAAWRRQLGPERFRILRKAGTERAFSSPLNAEKRRGTYHCAGCNQPLFASSAKYDSGTGWPAFKAPIARGRIGYARDTSLGMIRTEEHCARCGGHLGHVFDDGPPPLGKRHCINGLALRFRPA
ncbi:peptide-methionine (R)-S-oxide reductase MsrB [Sphingomicrobium aestuariivivum]|uniref:peptide-methionine (R)-S-oxide reductase MsrB n=1 Tax=Sphingomicrobium aestuariivivum TaxID=1582356 RepID=UPI001FD6BCDC|nr:peptide-methionine (R)-S-oxide reductase MsrB [Sphingomicrobium aestuariivivum]MCJ8191855.1 peptide-methionine (R)-S-oxide reductase MsrB [Sphingomicrobium aestuariivivum]